MSMKRTLPNPLLLAVYLFMHVALRASYVAKYTASNTHP